MSIKQLMVIVVVMSMLTTALALHSTFDTVFFQAAQSGDSAVLKDRIAAGAPINAIHKDTGDTALLAAIKNGQLSSVIELLSHNADVLIFNNELKTPLTLVKDGYLKAVEVGDLASQQAFSNLLDAFVNNNCNQKDRDLLRAIILEQPLGVIRALKAGANPNARGRGKNGVTPLHYILRFFDPAERKTLVPMLLDKGADIQMQDDTGDTPLIEALLHGSLDMVQVLLDRGADPNKITFARKTPLHIVAEIEAPESVAIAQALLAHGAAVDAEDMQGRTPLMIAAYKQNAPLVRLLVDHGANQSKVPVYNKPTKQLPLLPVKAVVPNLGIHATKPLPEVPHELDETLMEFAKSLIELQKAF